MTRETTRETILGVCRRFALPPAVTELLRAADSPQTATDDLCEIILRDELLATRLLQVADPDGQGNPGHYPSLRPVVGRIGPQAVAALAVSAGVGGVFIDLGNDPALDRDSFWQHALEVAGITQLLAGRIGFRPDEEAFAAGLLHDLGFLVMTEALGDEYGAFIRGVGTDLEWCEAKRARFGLDHAEAGSLLLRSWRLPERLVNAVARHHDAPAAESAADRLGLLVGLADRVALCTIRPRAALTRSRIEEKHRILGALGLRPIDLGLADRWVADQLIAVAARLGITIGSPVDVLTRANRRLREMHQETECLLFESVGSPPDQAAREILEAICATFSHYLNNATTTILGHAELVQMAVQRGLVSDPDGRLVESMRMIESAVVNISAVLSEMKHLTDFDIVSYHDRARILNIDDGVRRRAAAMRTR